MLSHHKLLFYLTISYFILPYDISAENNQQPSVVIMIDITIKFNNFDLKKKKSPKGVAKTLVQTNRLNSICYCSHGFSIHVSLSKQAQGHLYWTTFMDENDLAVVDLSLGEFFNTVIR